MLIRKPRTVQSAFNNALILIVFNNGSSFTLQSQFQLPLFSLSHFAPVNGESETVKHVMVLPCCHGNNIFLSPTSCSLSRWVHCFFMVNLILIGFIALKIYLIKPKSVSLCPRLRYMLEKWKITFDKGKHVGAVFMYLSKAFDTINHNLLIAKLKAYGFF